MLDNGNRLTKEDMDLIETDIETAVVLIKKYAIMYSGKEHYEQLGSSCTMSIVNTVNTVIGSADYLDGHFIMPDQINVERLAEWFVKNKDFDRDTDIITYFMADYIKRKVNQLYRMINRNTENMEDISTTLTIIGYKKTRGKLKREIQMRKKKGFKIIRLDKKEKIWNLGNARLGEQMAVLDGEVAKDELLLGDENNRIEQRKVVPKFILGAAFL